jgi:hypothetical protein
VTGCVGEGTAAAFNIDIALVSFRCDATGKAGVAGC